MNCKCMIELLLWVFVFGVFAAPAQTPSSSNTYTFVTVDYPNALSTHVTGINDRGDLAGSFRLPDEGPGPTLHGFTLLHGIFAQVDVPAAQFTHCIAINNRDEVTGFYGTQMGFMDSFSPMALWRLFESGLCN